MVPAEVTRSRGNSPKESTMKRILFALMLALSVATVVGCGSGSPTKAPGSGAK